MVRVLKTEKRYHDFTSEAWERYPKEALERLNYVKNNAPTEIYNLFLVDTLKFMLSGSEDQELSVSAKGLKSLCKGLLLALENMHSDTPLQVYEDMLGFYEISIINSIANLQQNKDNLQEAKKEAFYNNLYW